MASADGQIFVPMVRHAMDKRPGRISLRDAHRMIVEGSARTSAGETLVEATARQRDLYAREVEELGATGCTTLREALERHGRESRLYLDAKAAVDARSAHKRNFSAVIPAAVFDGQGRRTEHVSALSGLVVIDLDHLDQEAASLTLGELRQLDSCVLCFVSPSGAGVKAWIAVEPVPTDVAQYTSAWQDMADFLEAHLTGSPTVDPSGKDATRLCFLAHDPEAYLNPDTQPRTWNPPQQPQQPDPPDSPPSIPSPPGNDGTDDTEVDRDALSWVAPPEDYNAWLSWLPTLKALGLSIEEVEAWSAAGAKYTAGEVASRWERLPKDTLDDSRNKLRGHAYNLGWRPRQRLEVARYDYLNADGSLRFQVVRYEPKAFLQRRPDPESPGGWVWNLKGVSPILYLLPELRRAGRAATVWVVEGEQDADLLHFLGLAATTNPQGPGKWRQSFTREFRGRQVAIVPDNDRQGVDHAVQVANAIDTVAKEVRIVNLPDLPEGGDVSDYLGQGRTVQDLEDLLAGILPFEPDDTGQDATPDQGRPDWKLSPLLESAVKVTQLLSEAGHFVYSGEQAFYFHQDSRQLMSLDEDNLQLRLLLGNQFRINGRDQLYGYLVDHLFREAFASGREALIRRFSHYDEASNTVYLDMGQGRMLKITADSISVHDNGHDDVLFHPIWKYQPWDYIPPAKRPEKVLFRQYINRINFTSEDSDFDVEDQQVLLLAWLLSFAFESIMPTKVLAAAVGPSGSGKSSMFRNAGRILLGPRFQVSSLSKEAEGEKDFWVALTHSFYRCYDNVDESVRWLPDALAQITTGAERPSRRKYTDNALIETQVSCMVAITTRTPRECLRREDVASRTLLFKVKKLEQVKPEYQVLEEIGRMRDAFLSDYAGMVQKVLARPLSEVRIVDPGIRMADFARIASWIGHGLSDEMAKLIDRALTRMTSSQHRFAVEEDPVAAALEIWLGRTQPPAEGEMELNVPAPPNEGRPVVTSTLLSELNAVAREFGMRLGVRSPVALGVYLKNQFEALSQVFSIERPEARNSRGKTWVFRFRSGEEEPPSDSTGK